MHMGEKYLTLSELNIEGQFLGFVGEKPGKYKYLQLAISSGNIKLKFLKIYVVSRFIFSSW